MLHATARSITSDGSISYEVSLGRTCTDGDPTDDRKVRRPWDETQEIDKILERLLYIAEIIGKAYEPEKPQITSETGALKERARIIYMWSQAAENAEAGKNEIIADAWRNLASQCQEALRNKLTPSKGKKK